MATRLIRHQQVLKKIHDGLSDDQRLNHLMLKRLYQSVMNGNRIHTGILVRAIKIVFPKSDVMVADTLFRAFWKLGHYRRAIQVYIKIGRLLWLAEKVGRYYERRGQLRESMKEYEYLIGEYQRMGIIPLPKGPEVVFKIGKYYADKDEGKARKYLKAYISAEQRHNDPAFYLRHQNQAKRILTKLSP